jgi:hypothetical protein
MTYILDVLQNFHVVCERPSPENARSVVALQDTEQERRNCERYGCILHKGLYLDE